MTSLKNQDTVEYEGQPQFESTEAADKSHGAGNGNTDEDNDEQIIAGIVEKYTQNHEYYFLDKPRFFLRRVFENFYEEVSEPRITSLIAKAEDIDYDFVPRIVTQLKIACLKTQNDIGANPNHIVFADGLRDTQAFSKPTEKGLIYVNRLNARYGTDYPLEAAVRQFFDNILGATKKDNDCSTGFLEVLAQIFFSSRPLRCMLYVFGNGPGLLQLIDFICNAGGGYCEKQDMSALQRIMYLPDYARLRLRDTRLLMVSFLPNSLLANSEVLKRFIGERQHSSDLFQSRVEIKQRFTTLFYSNKRHQFFSPDPEYWNHVLPFQIGEAKRLTPRQYEQQSQEIENLFQLINNPEGYDALFLILRRLYLDQVQNGFHIRESVLKLRRLLGGIEPELDDFWIECTDEDLTSELKTRSFYDAYVAWARENKVKRVFSIREFSMQSVEKRFVGKKMSNGAYLTGRRLKAEFDPEIKLKVEKLKRARRGNIRRPA